jgi:hypothetical protein
MAPAQTDINNQSSDSLYELKINVGNFGIETTDFLTQNHTQNNVSNSVVAANKYLKYIFYGVYDSSGNR